MKFDQYKFVTHQTFGNLDEGGTPAARFAAVPADLHPLVLAYIGDAFFNLYVRTKLLSFEQSKVRVLHSYGARMVSATWQAFALRAMEVELTESEKAVVRRGRNTKSTVPKSASVADYRYSTGFEALLGYLYLSGDHSRMEKIAARAFADISRKLANFDGSSEEPCK